MNAALRLRTEDFPFIRVERRKETIFQINYVENFNLIAVRGWSNTADVATKYQQLIGQINTHLHTKNCLNLHIKYDVFDLASLRYLFKITKILNKAHANGKSVRIYWSTTSNNTRDMAATGKDLAAMCDFNIVVSHL